MSNVVPFRSARRPQPKGCDAASVAADLLAVAESLQDLVARAALMGRPALEVERTVQHLLDAVGAVERAADCVGEGDEAPPSSA